MSETHTVAPGEYMEKIADLYGFSDYTVIYNDAHNAAFKAARPNPHILHPGDAVFIPDKAPGQDPAATDKKHTYVLSAPKMTLNVYIRRNGQPLKNEKYTLKFTPVGGKEQTLTGTTGADGHVFQEKKIPLKTEQAVLTFSSMPKYNRTLNLGFLHPITLPSGVQMRLNNLGFGCGPATGAPSAAYTAALQAFQKKHLPGNVTGVADNATIDALRTEYEKGEKS